MNEKQPLFKKTHIVAIFFFFSIFLTTTAAAAASVTLRWDPNDPVPEGYRLFVRRTDQAYSYNQPNWQGKAATYTLNNLEDQTEYYFVLRSFDSGIIGANTAKVHYIPPISGSPGSVNTSVVLDPRFSETTLTGGVEYYTDRSHQLNILPTSYDDMTAIITPNADRNRTEANGYLSFTMPYAGTVYVAYNSRATSEPDWINGFVDIGDVFRSNTKQLRSNLWEIISEDFPYIFLQRILSGNQYWGPCLNGI